MVPHLLRALLLIEKRDSLLAAHTAAVFVAQSYEMKKCYWAITLSGVEPPPRSRQQPYGPVARMDPNSPMSLPTDAILRMNQSYCR